MKKLLLVLAFILVAALAALLAWGPHGVMARLGGHGPDQGQHMHGADGHDEVNMPGLRGADATEQESAELAILFRNFETLERTVERLPDGIRTVTSSSDPEVMDALISHVTGMIARVEEGRDPQIIIQSPTLRFFFDRPDALRTEIEITGAGVVVTQTTDDPELLQALFTHADEVSDMAERGMQAVHDRMAPLHHGGN